MTLDDVTTFLNQPLVSSGLTFVGTMLGSYLKREWDLRAMRREEEEKLARAQLRLKTMQVVAGIELVSEQRKQMGFAATPSEVKLANAKTELADSGHTEAEIVKAIHDVLPLAREQAKQVIARSVLPLGPGASGEHVIIIPPHDPPPLQRPSGDHPTFGRVGITEPKPFDMPKQSATLNLDAIRDAHEVDEDA